MKEEKSKDALPYTCTPAYDRSSCGNCVCATCYEQEFCDRCSSCKELSHKKTPVDVTKARIATNSTTGDADMIDRQHLLFFINLFCVLSERSW